MKKQAKKQTRNKKTIAAKLDNLITLSRSNPSLRAIITTGRTRTGESGYSGGRARKKIWTGPTLQYLRQFGINVTCGNDAPRGGANGEYVELHWDKRKNPLIHKLMAIYNRKISLDKIRAQKEQEREIKKIEAEERQIREYVNTILTNHKHLRVTKTLLGKIPNQTLTAALRQENLILESKTYFKVLSGIETEIERLNQQP